MRIELISLLWQSSVPVSYTHLNCLHKDKGHICTFFIQNKEHQYFIQQKRKKDDAALYLSLIHILSVSQNNSYIYVDNKLLLYIILYKREMCIRDRFLHIFWGSSVWEEVACVGVSQLVEMEILKSVQPFCNWSAGNAECAWQFQTCLLYTSRCV